CAKADTSARLFCMITSPVYGPVKPAALSPAAALSRSNGNALAFASSYAGELFGHGSVDGNSMPCCTVFAHRPRSTAYSSAWRACLLFHGGTWQLMPKHEKLPAENR